MPSYYVPATPKTPEAAPETSGLSKGDVIRYLLGAGLRLGGQYGGAVLGGLSGAALAPETGGASLLGIPAAAAAGGAIGGGLGEAAAEYIEPGYDKHGINKGRVGVSAALGAIPGAWMVKAGKPLASAAIGGGINTAAMVGNKVAEGQPLSKAADPREWSGMDIALGPVAGSVIGGGLSMLHGRIAPQPVETPVPIDTGVQVGPPKPTPSSQAGLRISLGKAHAGSPLNAEEHAAILAETNKQPAGPVARSVWGPKGKPSDMSLTDIAAAEEAAAKDAAARAADKAPTGWTMQNAAQEARNLEAKEKYGAAIAKEMDKDIAEREAQAKIDQIIEANKLKDQPPTVTATVKASDRTATQKFVQEPEDTADTGGGGVAEGYTSAPGSGGGGGKPPKGGPNRLLEDQDRWKRGVPSPEAEAPVEPVPVEERPTNRVFASEATAQAAANALGGKVVPLGKSFKLVFPDEMAAEVPVEGATPPPEATSAAEPPVTPSPAPVAPETAAEVPEPAVGAPAPELSFEERVALAKRGLQPPSVAGDTPAYSVHLPEMMAQDMEKLGLPISPNIAAQRMGPHPAPAVPEAHSTPQMAAPVAALPAQPPPMAGMLPPEPVPLPEGAGPAAYSAVPEPKTEGLPPLPDRRGPGRVNTAAEDFQYNQMREKMGALGAGTPPEAATSLPPAGEPPVEPPPVAEKPAPKPRTPKTPKAVEPPTPLTPEEQHGVNWIAAEYDAQGYTPGKLSATPEGGEQYSPRQGGAPVHHDIQQVAGRSATRAQVQDAIRKGLAGEKLTPKQKDLFEAVKRVGATWTRAAINGENGVIGQRVPAVGMEDFPHTLESRSLLPPEAGGPLPGSTEPEPPSGSIPTKGLVINEKTHLDHGLSPEHLDWIQSQVGDQTGFFIKTLEMPENLPPIESALHGPISGDAPVLDSEVTHAPRGERPYPSRLVDRAPRPTRQVTVIGGPSKDGEMVLYTAFGGPLAPQEIGDPGVRDMLASQKFWSEHALSNPNRPTTVDALPTGEGQPRLPGETGNRVPQVSPKFEMPVQSTAPFELKSQVAPEAEAAAAKAAAPELPLEAPAPEAPKPVAEAAPAEPEAPKPAEPKTPLSKKVFSFAKTKDADERVIVDEAKNKVGTIYKSWSRLGGEGWTSDGVQTDRTMDEAAKRLWRRLNPTEKMPEMPAYKESAIPTPAEPTPEVPPVAEAAPAAPVAAEPPAPEAPAAPPAAPGSLAEYADKLEVEAKAAGEKYASLKGTPEGKEMVPDIHPRAKPNTTLTAERAAARDATELKRAAERARAAANDAAGIKAPEAPAPAPEAPVAAAPEVPKAPEPAPAAPIAAAPAPKPEMPPIVQSNKPMIGTEELKAQLGVSMRTILRWKAEGKLPHVMVGRQIRFRPEEIEKWLAGNAAKIMKEDPNDVGAVQAQLLLRGATGLIGAGIGATQTPKDPLKGALLGGMAGVMAPSVASLLLRSVQSNKNMDASMIEDAVGKVRDTVKTGVRLLPDYQRFSLLANPVNLPVNMWVGPWGSGVMAALTDALQGEQKGINALKSLANPKKFLGGWWKAREEAGQLIESAYTRAEAPTSESAPEWFKKITEFPGAGMTAGDVSIRDILEEAGYSIPEARRITLTSEPYTAFGHGIAALKKGARTEQGAKSFVINMMMPFYRTNVNQLEQGLERTPILGFFAQHWKDVSAEPIPTQLVQQGIGGVVIWGSYQLGKSTPVGYAPFARKFVNDLGGQYGTLASTAFMAGQATRQGKSAIKGATSSLVNRDLPMPSTQPITDLVETATTGKIPSSLIPKMVSAPVSAISSLVSRGKPSTRPNIVPRNGSYYVPQK